MKKWFFSALAVAMVALSLPLADKPALAANNLIPNPSVEIADSQNPNEPEGWSPGYIWGDLDATFSYLNTGQEGSRSIKVQITRFNFGDAKWFFEPIKIRGARSFETTR